MYTKRPKKDKKVIKLLRDNQFSFNSEEIEAKESLKIIFKKYINNARLHYLYLNLIEKEKPFRQRTLLSNYLLNMKPEYALNALLNFGIVTRRKKILAQKSTHLDVIRDVLLIAFENIESSLNEISQNKGTERIRIFYIKYCEFTSIDIPKDDKKRLLDWFMKNEKELFLCSYLFKYDNLIVGYPFRTFCRSSKEVRIELIKKVVDTLKDFDIENLFSTARIY